MALDYGLTGKNMRASKAKQLGVADEVVSRPILEDVAIVLAQEARFRGQARNRQEEGRQKAAARRRDLRASRSRRTRSDGRFSSKRRTMTLKKTRGHYPAP